MKPHVTLHMLSSIDGRITTKSWPEGRNYGEIYEAVHRDLKGDAWIVGRVTMGEFAEGEPNPVKASEAFPRQTWKAPSVSEGLYAVCLDAKGKLHLNIERANGDPVIAVLTTSVSDDHLAELRRDRISYIFAGDDDLDLSQALDLLAHEFGIKRLLLEGGGGINGSFLTAGLIDEISLLVVPLADGTSGPSVFDRPDSTARPHKLVSATTIEEDVLHIIYRLEDQP